MDDKFSKLVSESTLAVLIAASPTRDRFMFLPLDAPTDEAVTAAAKCGFQFVGVVGLDQQCVPRTALAVELSAESERVLVDAFVALFERAVKHVEGALWLKNLHALPDTREN